jgi:hypothetical protein
MAFGNWHIPYAFSHCQKSQCECISIINLVQEEHATVTKLSALCIAMQVRIGRWRSTQIRWHILTVMSCRLSWMRMTHSSIWALQLQCRLLPGNREWRDIVENFLERNWDARWWFCSLASAASTFDFRWRPVHITWGMKTWQAGAYCTFSSI